MRITLASSAQVLEFQCRAVGLPAPNLEFGFWPGRRFAFDLAWPALWLAVEVEGVVYSRTGGHQLDGRHVSARGFRQDIEKYAEATARGWTVLRVLPAHVTNGDAVGWIERTIARRVAA